ncbi:MFS transporter [Pseudonocardia acidicola]|uniref:MFS transporter n=1 Tax=Pseudonocardia acidicola TaxID=2724939 RepID=A0ABX1SDY8_9PSEU|nr:MFS transporter [Pseudonocardia acidicola]NMH99790.1 MFS transporter [Pseudonocardia acidicola]
MASGSATADLPGPRRAVPPAWAPLRRRVFRALWIAQFVGNLGTWAQLVGAQWLMGDLGGDGLAVALVQTAVTLPVFLLVVPAGALGDMFDRRRLLLCGQLLMTLGAGALAALTAAGRMTPALLLGLIAVMGIGQALSVPSFQAIQPELVGPDEVPAAALLNGANANVGRAIGPAIGGVLISTIGPEATFALNAVSFLGVLLVLALWRREADPRPLGHERLVRAVRAGARYVRSSPLFATVLVRSAMFMLFASALWALLPVVARGPLRLDAGGYGLLLGGVGVGAILGAFVVPVVRARAGTELVVGGGALVYAAAMLVAGVVRSVPVVAGALMVTGLAWVAVLSTLNASAQVVLPGWTRARALAYFQLAYMGGQALGGVLWGAIAQLAGPGAALTVAGIGLALSVPVAWRRLSLHDQSPDVTAVRHLPEPPPVPRIDTGPVLVTVEWRVPPENVADFLVAMRPVGRARRRTGAKLWGLFRDLEDPGCFLEVFTVADWPEHLRQHLERGTAMDRDAEAWARRLVAPGTEPRVRHLVWAYATEWSAVPAQA